MNVAAQIKNRKGYDYNYDYCFEKLQLKDSIATSAGKLILNKIYSSPNSNDIEQWEHNWLDCGRSHFNLKQVDEYKTKKYSCYTQQPSTVKDIANIKSAISQLDSTINSQEDFFSNFRNKLEKGKSYYLGFSIMYKMSEKETQQLEENKPQREYLFSMKEQIDNSLKEQLYEIYDGAYFNECYCNYTFSFSKKGKLKSLKANHENFISRLFNKDKRKHYKEAKKLLKKLNLSDLKLRHGFTRSIHFYEKGYNIHDYTIY
ncbi:hypothetical protein GN157_17030 [Flavobacterium rakeshii]|uniref:Uncharacterized protein n=1 Tax=Flavobacterium rakeshii TaxID=1038845 RepID=A0A6N8HI95_9FLAO|nr:hypothetical protein [Flavobacterium rakeshii]MUV05420.1 hypothetical protein [Flavobacterium rakeshii]